MVPIIIASLVCCSVMCYADCGGQDRDDRASASAGGDATVSARSRMVERQLRTRGIKSEAVLRAMAKVPRHRYVPASQAASAY